MRFIVKAYAYFTSKFEILIKYLICELLDKVYNFFSFHVINN
jgi:hypothetical protein